MILFASKIIHTNKKYFTLYQFIEFSINYGKLVLHKNKIS